MARKKIQWYRLETSIIGGKVIAHFKFDKNGDWAHRSDVAPYILEVKNQRTTAKGSPRRKAAAASV
jgi:hypothetical protein